MATSCAMQHAAATASHREDNAAPAWTTALRNCAVGLAAAATVLSSAVIAPPQAAARAPSGDSVTNARALLRNALPINNKDIREIQKALEGINEDLRIPGQKSLGPISRAVNKSKAALNSSRSKLTSAFNPDLKDDGVKALDGLAASLKNFDGVLEAKDKQGIPAATAEALRYVGDAEAALVKGFPYEVPAEFANLPQLKGRATIKMDFKLKEKRENGVSGGTMVIVADGYNAPITAGNFVDLVSKGFYNNMEVQRADGFIVQTGNPGPPAEGYVDESTGEVRRIPFEVKVEGDKEPIYGETLEDNGRFNDTPVLPFNAFGTLALARAEFEANSGSSQVFWLLKESELTPTGSNLLDGRYAVFGYVTDGEELLAQMQVGDTITSAKVVSGLDKLQAPKVTAKAQAKEA
ncbi:hypothetical protein WJX73_008988 [Symbiochloris irregularis]|uniref:peptidylprolyl isomerase n=1 Tax=Symbiochloris irregularis TaxID=706552 RepID=A0AAW1NR08_9CHLO